MARLCSVVIVVLIATCATGQITAVYIDASQFQSGTDDYQKLALAAAQCPANGCIIDASALSGSSPSLSRIIAGTSGAPITILGWQGNETPANGVQLTLGPYVRFEGASRSATRITANAGTSTSPPISVTGPYVTIDSIQITGNRLQLAANSSTGAVCINTSGNDVTITNNILLNCGADAIAVANGERLLVANNLIEQALNSGVIVNEGTTANLYDARIQDNTIYDSYISDSANAHYSIDVICSGGPSQCRGAKILRNVVMNDIIGGDNSGWGFSCNNPSGAPTSNDTGCGGIQTTWTGETELEVASNKIQNTKTEGISVNADHVNVHDNQGRLNGISSVTSYSITNSSCSSGTCTESTASTTGLSSGYVVVFYGMTTATCLNGHAMAVSNIVANTSFQVTTDIYSTLTPCSGQTGSEGGTATAGLNVTNGGAGGVLVYVPADGLTHGYSNISTNQCIDCGYSIHPTFGTSGGSGNSTLTDVTIQGNTYSQVSLPGFGYGLFIQNALNAAATWENSTIAGNDWSGAGTSNAIHSTNAGTAISFQSTLGFWGNKGAAGTMTAANATLFPSPLQVLGGIDAWNSITLNGSTSGSTALSVTATGGTLNLGSTNATVTSGGALTVTSCAGCGASTVYNTASSGTNTNISPTNMVASTSAQHDYTFGWTVSLTTAGTGCSGNTTVVLNAIFTDPSASASSTQALGTVTVASGNGTVGFAASGVGNILAKSGTAVQYSTSSYTAGSGCSVDPSYTVHPTLVQLW